MLDLFAGTGAWSFEALSRGAASAIAVDDDPRVIKQLLANARALGLQSSLRVARVDLFGPAAEVVQRLPTVKEGFDLVFADAPYSETEHVSGLLSELSAQGRLADGAWIAVEHPAKHDWTWPNPLAPVAEYRYGHTVISLGTHAPEKGSL